MNWKDRYMAALLEVDDGKLLSLIHETEVAMASRSKSVPRVTDAEQLEMKNANCTLGILKKHLQGRPVSTKVQQ